VRSDLAFAGILLTLAALALAAPGRAQSAVTPHKGAVTFAGPTDRYLMNGSWLLRKDPGNRGLGQGYWRPGSAGGWHKTTVPGAWNAHDYSSASMGGGIAWYRKDFKLPSSASNLDWIVHFESVRYHAIVWLNGQRVGSHDGAWLPWELNLRGLSRKGTNSLVVRVDNRPGSHDLPPRRLTIEGQPNGGWWNWGGILGDVYLRRVDGIDIPTVQVLPELPCRTCDATIRYHVTVRNHGRAHAVSVSSTFGGQPVSLGSRTVGAGKTTQFTGSLTVAKPHLWSPLDPHLYQVSIQASGGGSAGWQLESGIRSVNVVNGRLFINWRPASPRGGFFHEDSPKTNGAADPARMQLVIDRLKSIGGTLLRTHYPLDPYFHQLADRQGVLIWSEIPVFQISGRLLALKDVRRAAARMLRDNILANGSHPSVIAWSLGNELNPEPTSVEASYYADQAKLVHSLDPTRPVALAIQGYPLAGCQPAYAPIQLLGLNSYFGWYPGPNGSIADRSQLSAFLDQMRACYTQQALMVTEFGAEANRHGPTEERGTYEFQADIMNYHLSIYANKPWLSGAIGMLMAFHARPGWAGGNPYPSPPMHEKGIFDFLGNPKPAAGVVSAWYHNTQQYDLPGGQ
jgi:beta-glucuronidase